MNIGLIGAGKVGFSLGKLFAHGGVPVTGYYSRHRESAQEAALFTESTCYTSLEQLIKDSDALFFTVPDGMITTVYREAMQYELSGKRLCHCSGALSAADAFPGIADTGATGYSIHPLFPVSNRYHAYRELAGAFFCLEGDPSGLPIWQNQLESLGLRVQVISAEAKVRYHAACVFASNLMCALMDESISLLTECGFTIDFAQQALAPLVRSNMEHLLQDGPADALTGPVERCDTATVSKHLRCFSTSQERELYRLLSRRLVDVAAQKNPARSYEPLLAILEKESDEYAKEEHN